MKNNIIYSDLLTGKKLPDKIFKKKYNKYVLIDFEEFFGLNFLTILKKYQKEKDISMLYFESLTPVNFFKLSFKLNDSEYEIFSLFREKIEKKEYIDLPISPYLLTEIGICYSKSENILIYLDRSYEVAIIALMNALDYSYFSNIEIKENYFNIEF